MYLQTYLLTWSLYLITYWLTWLISSRFSTVLGVVWCLHCRTFWWSGEPFYVRIPFLTTTNDVYVGARTFSLSVEDAKRCNAVFPGTVGEPTFLLRTTIRATFGIKIQTRSQRCLLFPSTRITGMIKRWTVQLLKNSSEGVNHPATPGSPKA